MPAWRLDPADSIVLVVDLQPKFLSGIENAAAILNRAEFLARVAAALEVPVVATEQNVDRMGGTDGRLTPWIQRSEPKMAFSACVPGLLDSMKRRSVVMVGIETHICVSQTTIDLVEGGYRVAYCVDALGSRSADRHAAGLARIASTGSMPIHTEAVAYDWMRTADHGKFREVLALVKQFA